MTEAISAQANGNGQTTYSKDAPEFKIVHRVGSIPVVQDGLATLESIVNSTAFTANVYSVAGVLVTKSLNVATPILVKTKPLVDRADGIANSGLDMIENKFPYPFKTSTSDMYAGANAQVKGLYDARVAPIMHNEIIQRAIDQIYELNKSLGGVANAVKARVVSTSSDASAQAHALANALVDQLYQLSAHGSSLSEELKDSIGSAYSDVRGILAQKDKDTSKKAGELAQYVQGIVQPELDKALAYISAKKDKAESAAGEGSDKAAAKFDQAKSDAANGVESAKSKAQEVQDQAQS